MKTLLIVGLTLLSIAVIGQPQKKSVVIGSMTTRPNALLIVNPGNSDQGVLLPQLTTGQRLSMRPSSPQEDGLIVFDKSANAYYYWSNGSWQKLRTDDTKKVKFRSIDPAEFRNLNPERNTNQSNAVVFETDHSFITAGRDGQGEEIIASIGIPHGATLREMTVFYMDNDDDNIKVRLLRKSLSGNSEQVLIWESSGASPLVNSISLTNFGNKETIDLENYTYRLIVTFDLDDSETIDTPATANQRLYGVRIKYEE